MVGQAMDSLFMLVWIKSMARAFGVVAIVMSSACQTTAIGTSLSALDRTPSPVVLEPAQKSIEHAEKAPIPADDGAPRIAESESADSERLLYYRGKRGALTDGAQSTTSVADGSLQLNFVNAPAGDVARALINDVFGQTLSIADGAQGNITLTSPEPVSAPAALGALETALAETGLTLIERSNGYLLTKFDRVSDQSATSFANGPRAIGYSATVVPVKHAAPSTLIQLVGSFSSKRLKLEANNELGLIIIKGAQVEAREAVRAIKTFDAPYLTDRVFGMFDIRYADVQTIKTEIEAVMGLSGAGINRPVEIIALPRLNRLFVAARDEDYFSETEGWVDRLDKSAGGDERRLRYYTAQNTPASVLAQQLSAAFGGASPLSFSDEARGEEGGVVRPQPVSSPLDLDRISIVPDELNNALIIRATDTEYREILELVARMDVLAPQVLIEATIAEVTLTDDLSFGVRWSYDNAESSAILSDASAIASVFPGFNYTYIDGGVRAALNTLASVTDVNVLSAPSIMVQNNQSANLQVGDEVPIVTQQATSIADDAAPIVSTIQLRDTGVILEVKPRINASDVVVLDITQEVSDVVPTTTSGIDSPTIQQRRFTSTVAVKDNGTVALGGLIREVQTESNSGIPVLKDIPAIGHAFKSTDYSTRRTELMIFLTPRIIRDDKDARDALDHLRQEMSRLDERMIRVSSEIE